MGYHRRVTLRCLCEDLNSDWTDARQQRGYAAVREALAGDPTDGAIANMLDELPTPALASHPLVASFFASFESDDAGIQRESITGLTNPYWWKQKVSRWRGAATDADVVGEGEAWLCGGGLRAGGEARDFYATFMQSVQQHGPTSVLPAAEDRRYQVVEEKLARYEAWLDQVRLSTLVSLHECDRAGERRQVHIPVPFPARVADPLAHFTFDLARIEEGDAELVELLITVHIDDHQHADLIWSALDAARSVVEPVADAWRVLPGIGSDQEWSTFVSSEVLHLALYATETGEVPDRARGAMRLGVQAHYAPKDRIVEASVVGDAIRGLCGIWFVPTSDPDQLPVCPACRAVHEQLT